MRDLTVFVWAFVISTVIAAPPHSRDGSRGNLVRHYALLRRIWAGDGSQIVAPAHRLRYRCRLNRPTGTHCAAQRCGCSCRQQRDECSNNIAAHPAPQRTAPSESKDLTIARPRGHLIAARPCSSVGSDVLRSVRYDVLVPMQAGN